MNNRIVGFALGVFLALASTANAQYDDLGARRSTAGRIQRQHGIVVDPSAYTLTDLLDLEGRVSTAARINRSYHVLIDYHQSSLTELLDIEGRLSTAARLKRSHQIDVDYQQHSLSDLLEIEGRVSTASRIQRRYGVQLDWQSSSLTSLLQTESSLSLGKARTETPSATPPTGSVPADDVSTPPTSVFQSSSETPQTPQEIPPSHTTAPTYGHYYDPSYRPAVGDHYTSGYVRRDGTYVAGHFQTNPDDSFWNNWSSSGSVNPYTGKVGTKLPPYSTSTGSTYVSGYFRSNGTYVQGHSRSK